MTKSHSLTIIWLLVITVLINAQLQPDGNIFSVLSNQPQTSRSLNSDYLERRGAWPYGSSIAIAVDSLRDLIFLGSGGAVIVLDGADKNNPT
ncbi:MAG: hypothetical protein OQK29_07815, partial [Ignavibacteriaceae bacterium]|nr:hypothetical protein [Ignavibacteriaceae bacterium]